MGWFSKGPSIERQLKEVYVPMFMQSGMPISQANEQFSEWLREAKQWSQKEGMDKLPQNFGDLLLQNEATAPNIKAKLDKVRREGVTDEDIRVWWNLHDLERRFMLMQDDVSRGASWVHYLDEVGDAKMAAMSPAERAVVMDEAAAQTRKYFPFWGDPDDCTHVSGDDRPLPHELKFRINLWIQRKQSDPTFKEELERSTTFNALVRKEIAKGNL